MGSKKTTKNTEHGTQTVAPPTWTMPGIQDASSKVIGALGSLPQSTYRGDMVAVPDAPGTQGIADAYRGSAALSGDMSSFVHGQMAGSTTMPTFGTTLPTEHFSLAPAQDLNGVIAAAIHPVFQELTQSILPGIKSSALDSGAYSGDRAMSVVPGQAINASNEAAQRLAAQIGYEDYNNRENRRLSAFESDSDRDLAGFNADTQRGLGLGDLLTSRLAQLPDLADTVMRMSAGRGDLLGQAQGTELNRRQQEINNTLGKEQYASAAPFMGLDVASQLLSALSGNYGTTTRDNQSKTVEKTGGLGPIVQGVMGLASMAMGMPGGLGSLGSLFGAAAPALGNASKLFASNPGKI